MTQVLIVGFGVTGRAVAARCAADGSRVMVLDDHPDAESVEAAGALGITMVDRPDAAGLAALLQEIDLVVPSPGVAAGHPVLSAAAAAGVAVRSEIELAWDRLHRRAAPRPLLVAITGTNGKTTVTTLVASILASSGLRAVTGGNIGRPLIDAVDADADVVVAEVSSFQLQHTAQWRPEVSGWLNLTEDHLDWHPSMAHYAAAKARNWARQGPGDTAVINIDDPQVLLAAADLPGGVRRVDVGTAVGAAYRDLSPAGAVDDPSSARLVGPDGVDLLRGLHLPRARPHDRGNALAAAALAVAAGATPDGVARGLAGAALLPHRVELVADGDGVRWYDDSKATTPASVLAATAGMRSVVLIAGGRNKGLDLRPLRRCAPPVHAVVAIGEAAGEVASAFDGAAVVRGAPDMAAAVATAGELSRPGDAVILSPGCASFDWYPSYAARGEDFVAAVHAHLTRSAPPFRAPSSLQVPPLQEERP